jgi:hypothetical protein
MTFSYKTRLSEASGTQNKHMVALGLVLQRYTKSVNFQRDWKQSKLDLQKLPPPVQRTTNLTKLYVGYLLWNSTITEVSTLLSNNLIALISSKAPRRGPTCCKWEHQNVPKATTYKILSHSSYMIFSNMCTVILSTSGSNHMQSLLKLF